MTGIRDVDRSPVHKIITIVILLACLGLSTYNNNVELKTAQLRMVGPTQYPVGSRCVSPFECKPCANESDTPHCSQTEFGGVDICWCKQHRLYLGEVCFAHEECKPKSCEARGEKVECSGHPQVCKCRAHHLGKDQCLNDSDCPSCEEEGEVSTCSGSPKTCKKCGTKYLTLFEKCANVGQCLYCADPRDKPGCIHPVLAPEYPKICVCKEHRYAEGHQCLADEECKCENKEDFGECYGHPRTCKCTPRETSKVGERCFKDEQCKPCANPRDTPHCATGGPGEGKICKCKLHRLYLGEECTASEECKPKPCVKKRETVECDGICKCSGK